MAKLLNMISLRFVGRAINAKWLGRSNNESRFITCAQYTCAMHNQAPTNQRQTCHVLVVLAKGIRLLVAFCWLSTSCTIYDPTRTCPHVKEGVMCVVHFEDWILTFAGVDKALAEIVEQFQCKYVGWALWCAVGRSTHESIFVTWAYYNCQFATWAQSTNAQPHIRVGIPKRESKLFQYYQSFGKQINYIFMVEHCHTDI